MDADSTDLQRSIFASKIRRARATPAAQKMVDAAVLFDDTLVGAFSAVAYGVARATKDADFVVACEPRRVVEIAAALGADFALERQMEFETLTQSKRNVVTHLPSGFAIEFFYLNPDPHHQERFRRRRRGLISQGGRAVLLPTAGDVVIQKLRCSGR